ncbi:fimbria/pilus outer membrane usher protein [Pantoea phytobeneficialis]|uniref:Fimbria/pilus outer membrane usher protein n=1 Tax=Pantoea phytobeneficialis TaxID=2052056 RepID=A0AAP9KPP1_9GAMM|nr:fimbria/pilus outer membrane usher protein [Pantoea phytobeneficialis]MDO6409194.1 fimbria/pilus outer membrane usher protein [Pantoea phytobeneficialis]QGR07063.1 fimbrial assembly protein [Pantoea phytobeneficialis]
MRFSPHPCALAVTSALCCLIPLISSAETFSELPPPPALQNNAAGQQYMLELIINQEEQGNIVPVEQKNGDFWLRRGDLERAGIPADKLQGQQINVNQLNSVKVDYDNQRQRLLLTVPPAWLPGQVIGQSHNGPRYPGRSSTGALLNYDFYATRTDHSGTRLATWNELRLFGAAGQFSSNGVWQQQLEGSAPQQQQGYIRYDTWWSNENEEAIVSWRAGDLITDSLSWSNSVRLGGVQIGRDFSVRPDLVTYPLPQFSGQAAVPSTVDLFINGYRSSQANVQPGPWSLTNVPFVNGAGDAVITTTDAVGRQVTTTLPFYVSSNLLRQGLSDYSFSAGAMRENYGIKNFDYGAAAASGSYRYGLTDWLMLETHAEGSDEVAMGGAGGQVKLGSWGVINGALAQSQMSGKPGTQYSWGYQYNNSWLSLGTQHTLRTVDFGNLALVGNRSDSEDTSYSLARRSAQYTASVSMNQYGSLGLAYLDINSGDGERTRLWNLSWSKNLWGNSSLYISASRDQQQGEWSGAISLVIPFGEQGSASVSMERDQQGENNQRIYLSRAMPSDGGYSWDASWANQGGNSGDYRQGSLRYRNNKVDTSAGFYGDDDNITQWADFSGALVLMDNRLFVANQINDAFVLVKTNYPDVNIRYENQSMGRTDKEGYLLVPSISSYYAAKYDIDTLDLPADMTSPRVEQRFAVKRQSGYLLNFPVEKLRSASVILHDSNGKPLPVSSQVLRAGQATEYVGWDGITWMENLEASNPIQVTTPDGRSCRTELTIANGQPLALKTYGPLTCALPPPPPGAALPNSENSTTGISP